MATWTKDKLVYLTLRFQQPPRCCTRHLALILFEGTSEGSVHESNASKANLMNSPRSSFERTGPICTCQKTLQSSRCSTGVPMPATNVSGFSD